MANTYHFIYLFIFTGMMTWLTPITLFTCLLILHKKCRSGKNSEGPAEISWTYVQQNENKFQKV
jgi:hypothetical protein